MQKQYKSKYLLLLSCVLCFTTWCYGQHMIRGVISSDDELVKSFFEVELTDTTFKQLDYLVLEQKTFFEVKIDSSYQVINLLVSTLGCSPYLQRVDFRNNKTVFLAIELKDCTQQLEEVVVTANQSFVQESGDTLTFDVDGFRVKTDLTLGDILSRMPGIEIDVNKQILYQGKRIKQIWVEGRDILNNQHSLALESLRAEDIETIQIVHEYKPFHLRFSQSHSSDVAMNIGLTEVAREKISGKAEGLAGINTKYQLSAEAFRARGNSGESVFLRSNNIGTTLMQPVEYLGLLPDFSSVGGGKSGEVEIVPIALLPDVTAFEETQHLFSVSIDRDIKDRVKTKATLVGVQKNSSQLANVETVFFDENSMFLGQSRNRKQLPMVLGHLNLEYKVSSQFLLSFDMNTNFNEQQSNNSRSGIYQQNLYLSEFISRDHYLQHLPVLTANVKHKSNWSSGHSIGVDVQNQSYDLAFVEDANQMPVYGQRLGNRERNTFLSSFLENKRNIFLLEIKNYLEFGNFRTGISFDELPGFENDLSYLYNWRNWRPNIRYGIKTDQWLAHLQVELANSRLEIAGHTFQRSWLNPLFRIKYNWSLTNFIGLSLKQTQTFLDQRNAFDLYQLHDNLQITHFAVEAGQSSRVRQASFYYFNSDKNKRSTVNCTMNYQESTNALSRYNRFENNFIISEIFLAEKAVNANFNLSFSYPLTEKKYQWKANLKTIFTSIIRSSLTNIDTRNLSFNTSLSSLWKGSWNAKWKLGYQVSNQMQGVIDQSWYTWIVGTSIRYKSKRWNSNIDYNWRLNQIADSYIPLHIVNFKIDYSVTTSFSLIFCGQDALNLNTSQALRFTTTPAFVEKMKYNRLEGSLMIGIKGRF